LITIVNPPDTEPENPVARVQLVDAVAYPATGVVDVGLIKAIWVVAAGFESKPPLDATGQAIVAPTALRSSRMKFDVVTLEPAISIL